MSDRITITPLKDGPDQVSGPVTVLDEAGNVVKEADTVFLCRCGNSANKPFCDGAHKREGWTSE